MRQTCSRAGDERRAAATTTAGWRAPWSHHAETRALRRSRFINATRSPQLTHPYRHHCRHHHHHNDDGGGGTSKLPGATRIFSPASRAASIWGFIAFLGLRARHVPRTKFFSLLGTAANRPHLHHAQLGGLAYFRQLWTEGTRPVMTPQARVLRVVLWRSRGSEGVSLRCGLQTWGLLCEVCGVLCSERGCSTVPLATRASLAQRKKVSESRRVR